MAMGHTAEGQALSSVSESGDTAVQIVFVGALDFSGDDFA
jgi:hypothetical protein